MSKVIQKKWKHACDVSNGGQAVPQKVQRLQDENNIAVAKIVN
jgi:hypothetical protein